MAQAPISRLVYQLWNWILVIGFLGYSIEYLNIPLERIPNMFERMVQVLSTRYYPADMAYIMD